MVCINPNLNVPYVTPGKSVTYNMRGGTMNPFNNMLLGSIIAREQKENFRNTNIVRNIWDGYSNPYQQRSNFCQRRSVFTVAQERGYFNSRFFS